MRRKSASSCKGIQNPESEGGEKGNPDHMENREVSNEICAVSLHDEKLRTISKRKNTFLDKNTKKNQKYYYKIVSVDKKQASLMSRPSKKVKSR